VTSRAFEYMIFAFIALNTIVLAMQVCLINWSDYWLIGNDIDCIDYIRGWPIGWLSGMLIAQSLQSIYNRSPELQFRPSTAIQIIIKFA
jgi:hypothetical protein